MRAISLWQPWATLMAIEAKKIETRSWGTSYRGPLAIHASSAIPRNAKILMGREPFFSVLYNAGFGYPKAHALGKIICVVDLEGCFLIDAGPLLISEQEKAFGDYTPGRFMWMTDNLRRLKKSIPWKGRQGLFDVPDEILKGVNHELCI